MKKTILSILIISAVLSATATVCADEWDGYYDGGYSDSYDYYADDYGSYDNGYSADYNYYDYGYYQPQVTEPVTLPQTVPAVPKKPKTVKAKRTFKKNKTISNKTIRSTADNETAVRNVGAEKLVIENSKLIRKGTVSSGEDHARYYGIGSALLTSKGNTYLNNSVVRAVGADGCGVFSLNKGCTWITDSRIVSKKHSYSLGAYRGSIYGSNVDISSANTAVTSADRGEIVLDRGSISGGRKNLIDVTGTVALNKFKLRSKSGISVQSGKSKLAIFDSNISCKSGYACEISNSAKKSSLGIYGTTLNNSGGGLFSVDNAKAAIALSDSKVKLKNKNLLTCTGAAECSFSADSQKLNGDITRESSSKLVMYLQNGSRFKGSIKLGDTLEEAKKCTLYIDSDSRWTVTADSHIDILYNKGTITDSKGNVVPIRAMDGTQYAQGKSKYTITVDNYFEKEPEKGYPQIAKWSDYEKSQPKAEGVSKTAVEEKTTESKPKETGKNKDSGVFRKEYIYYTAAAAVLIIGVCVAVALIKRRKKSQ